MKVINDICVTLVLAALGWVAGFVALVAWALICKAVFDHDLSNEVIPLLWGYASALCYCSFQDAWDKSDA
jgi:hypothetical protein